MDNLLYTEKIITDENRIWFSAYSHNGLYCMNRESKKIESVLKFPNEKPLAKRLYREVLHVGALLIFIPLRADAIAIYDYGSNMIQKIPLEKKVMNHKVVYRENAKFWTAVAYGKIIYLFGWTYPAIVKLNLEDGSMQYHTKWADELDLMIDYNGIGYFGDGVIRDEYAYIPVLCANKIMRFHLKTAVYEWINVESSIDGIVSLSDDGTDFWLIPRKYHKVIQYSSEYGVKNEIIIPYKDEKPFPFYTAFISQKKIFLLPAEINDVFCINRETENISRNEFLSDMLGKRKSNSCWSVVLSPMLSGEILFFINGNDYSWHWYNISTGEDCSVLVRVNGNAEAYIDRLFVESSVNNDYLLRENADFSLKRYLAYVSGLKV